MSQYANLLRQLAELAADQRRVARSLRAAVLAAEAMAGARTSLEITVLLQEIEGRYCDASDQLHDLARQSVKNPWA